MLLDFAVPTGLLKMFLNYTEVIIITYFDIYSIDSLKQKWCTFLTLVLRI